MARDADISTASGGPGPPDVTHNFSLTAHERPDANGRRRVAHQYFNHRLADAEAAAFLLLRGRRFDRVEVFRRTDEMHGWEMVAEFGPEDVEGGMPGADSERKVGG